MSRTRRARFESFYRTHYEPILAYALRRTSRAGAEDVVAETFLTAWRRFEAIPPDPLPWLYGVARRVLGNHVRGDRRREALTLRLRQRWALASVGRHQDPIEDALDEAELLEAFSLLSNLDREVLSLVAWEGLSAERAAAVLNCSSATFAVRLHRARRRLAQAIEFTRETSEASGA